MLHYGLTQKSFLQFLYNPNIDHKISGIDGLVWRVAPSWTNPES